MTANIGTADRILRLIVGVILLALIFVTDGGLRWIGLIGLIPIATAAVGWCPAYTMLGISTCASDHDRAHRA